MRQEQVQVWCFSPLSKPCIALWRSKLALIGSPILQLRRICSLESVFLSSKANLTTSTLLSAVLLCCIRIDAAPCFAYWPMVIFTCILS